MEGKLTFDYSKLRGRIVEMFGSQKEFSKAMNISQATLTSKLTGLTYFSQSEISRAGTLLRLEPESISSYFFPPKVEKTKLI